MIRNNWRSSKEVKGKLSEARGNKFRGELKEKERVALLEVFGGLKRIKEAEVVMEALIEEVVLAQVEAVREVDLGALSSF